MPRVVVINGKTYVYDNNDKLVGTADGDQSKNPAAFEPGGGTRGGTMQGTKASNIVGTSLGKDILVNAASQIPLAITSGGTGNIATMIRGIASLGSGFVADRLLNGEGKSAGDSAADAAVNTGVGMLTNKVPDILNGLMNNTAFDKAKGWGLKGVIGGVMNILKGEPVLPEVQATTPVIRGAGGRLKSNAANYQDFVNYKKKYSILNAITNTLGFGANSGIDAANTTTPTPPSQPVNIPGIGQQQ